MTTPDVIAGRRIDATVEIPYDLAMRLQEALCVGQAGGGAFADSCRRLESELLLCVFGEPEPVQPPLPFTE